MNLLTIFVFIFMFRTFDVNGKETALAVKNENVDIECKLDASIEDCGSTDPSRKGYSFAGTSLKNGSCKVAIRVTEKDEGILQCHISTQNKRLDADMNNVIWLGYKVKAIRKKISAIHGTSVTLECTTYKGLRPMKYCRFLPPDNMAISMKSKVARTNLLMNRYYYPSNKSLDRGDCAVTIHDVSYADYGSWICGGGLDDGKEYIDEIKLNVIESWTVTIIITSLISVMFFGALGVLAWLKRLRLRSVNLPRVPEEHELQHMRRRHTLTIPRLPRPQLRSSHIISVQPPTPIVSVEPPTPIKTVEPPTPIATVEPPTPIMTVKPPTPIMTVEPPTPIMTVKPPTPIVTVESPTP